MCVQRAAEAGVDQATGVDQTGVDQATAAKKRAFLRGRKVARARQKYKFIGLGRQCARSRPRFTPREAGVTWPTAARPHRDRKQSNSRPGDVGVNRDAGTVGRGDLDLDVAVGGGGVWRRVLATPVRPQQQSRSTHQNEPDWAAIHLARGNSRDLRGNIGRDGLAGRRNRVRLCDKSEHGDKSGEGTHGDHGGDEFLGRRDNQTAKWRVRSL